MIVSVTVVDTSARGVKVVFGSTDQRPFWLPRNHRAVVWSRQPEPGDAVSVTLPTWIVSRHHQLVELRHQRSIDLAAPAGLNPHLANKEGSFPMSDSNDNRGALFREQSKKSEKSPDMTGHLTIDGVRYRLAGWTREGKDGRKFLSLAASLPEQQQQQRPQSEQQNSYAAAKGRDQQRQPDRGGPTFSDEIPFAPVR
jgi:hypothetical protein